jgi:hypothetical protein
LAQYADWTGTKRLLLERWCTSVKEARISMHFEQKATFVMGRKLLKSLGQRIGFFMAVVIRPILSFEGNTPVETDKLYKEAIGTARTSMAVFRTEVGIGSREHDLVGHNLTISIRLL